MEINSSNNNIKNDLIPNEDEKNEELKDKIDNNTSPQNILNEEIKDDLSNKNDSFEIENKDNKHFQTKSNTDIEYILNNNIENEINQNKNKASSLFSNSDYQYVSELNKLDFMETNTEEFKPYVSKYPKKVFKKRGIDNKKNKKRKGKKKEKVNILDNIDEKSKIDEDKGNENEGNKKYSSYFGDSDNNVYFEIKQSNGIDKKLDKINIKKEELPENKDINKKDIETKSEDNNTFEVQSETLYIPKEN